MHATGILTKSGKKFWSTKDKGQKPFACKVNVITHTLALSLPSFSCGNGFKLTPALWLSLRWELAS